MRNFLKRFIQNDKLSTWFIVICGTTWSIAMLVVTAVAVWRHG